MWWWSIFPPTFPRHAFGFERRASCHAPSPQRFGSPNWTWTVMWPLPGFQRIPRGDTLPTTAELATAENTVVACRQPIPEAKAAVRSAGPVAFADRMKQWTTSFAHV
jgi:hypothetical protein